MSTFMNVSGVDLDLYVDGRPYAVDAGETVTVSDEFDFTLTDQAVWQISPPSVAVSPTPSAPVSVRESTPAVPDITPSDVVSASEGDN